MRQNGNAYSDHYISQSFSPLTFAAALVAAERYDWQ
jgi:hypothetical protein